VLPELNAGDLEGATTAMAGYTKGRNQRTGERMALRGLERRRREEIALFKAPAATVTLALVGGWLLATRWNSSHSEQACALDI
jgi:hypothetical protein